MNLAADSSDRRALDPGTVAGALGLSVVAGLCLPLRWGLGPPLVAIAIMALLADRHGRRMAALARHGYSLSLSTQPIGRRVALALSLALPTVVIATVAARGVSSIVVAYPAAIWGLMLAAFGGLVLTLLPVGPARWLLAGLLALAVPVAGVAGQRWEAAGQQSRGWAHGGHLLGIHPFQATAVIVDGYGPHDIPVNDYVEPDGSRGYGPDEVAAALQNSIRAIGRLHYAHGPARARMAFENVRVIAVTTEPVRETLDREPVERTESRLLAWSGTTGQRSSIQFVCPGQPVDPRGPDRDTVIKPNCPGKYLNEGSAGLNVTGRWAGYTEARGLERFGLARQWLGGARTHDARGDAVRNDEILWGAWLFLVGLAAATVPRREVGSAQEGLSAVAGAIGLAGLLVGLWMVIAHAEVPVIGWWRTSPLPGSGGGFDIREWTPALAIGGVAVATLGPGRGGTVGTSAIRVGAVPLALGVFAAAASVQASTWLRPDLYTRPEGLAFERFVAGFADALWEHAFGPDHWNVQELEGAVAAVVATLVAGAGVAMVSSFGTSIDPPRAARGRQWFRAVGVCGVVAVAAFVTVSRKTDGAAALVPAAMGLLMIHGSCLGMVAIRTRGRAVGTAVHVGLVALGLWLINVSVADLPANWFVEVCAGLGIAACVGSLIFVVPRGERRNSATKEGSERA